MNVYSKNLYLELLKLKENPELVLEQSKDFQIGFLQGIFDAEGSIRLERNHITISSKNPKTIKIVTKILNNLSIRIGKPFKDKNNVISIPFYGKDNILKFNEHVGFRHPEKRKRLEMLLDKNRL